MFVNHISGVSSPILMILDSKWGFLRSGNWLVILPCALHVSDTCFCIKNISLVFLVQSSKSDWKHQRYGYMQKHVSDTRRARGSITNQFPDPKNPHLESKIIKIGLGTPEIWLTNTDSFFSGTLCINLPNDIIMDSSYSVSFNQMPSSPGETSCWHLKSTTLVPIKWQH